MVRPLLGNLLEHAFVGVILFSLLLLTTSGSIGMPLLIDNVGVSWSGVFDLSIHRTDLPPLSMSLGELTALGDESGPFYSAQRKSVGIAPVWTGGNRSERETPGKPRVAADPIPEPSTLWLLGAGLIMLGGGLGRRLVKSSRQGCR